MVLTGTTMRSYSLLSATPQQEILTSYAGCSPRDVVTFTALDNHTLNLKYPNACENASIEHYRAQSCMAAISKPAVGPPEALKTQTLKP